MDRAPARRLHRIEHQVHRHLPELHAIGVDRRQIRIEVRHQQHAFVGRRRVQDLDDVHDDGVQIDRPHVERFLAYELTHAFDDVGRVAVGGGDVVDDRRELLARHARVGEHALERLCVAERCRQRLGQLVGDRGHQLAQSGAHVHVRELVQRLLGFDFHAFARRDVQVRDDGAAFSTLDAAEAQTGRSVPAGRLPVALDGPFGFAPGEHREQRVADTGDPGGIVRSHGGRIRQPRFAAFRRGERIGAVAGTGPPVVAVLDHAIAVEDREVGERGRQDRAAARLDATPPAVLRDQDDQRSRRVSTGEGATA